MRNRIRLIWDFLGPRAEGISEHHAAHLSEFARREGLMSQVGSECFAEGHWVAWLSVEAEDVDRVRAALKPMRAVQDEPEATPGPR